MGIHWWSWQVVVPGLSLVVLVVATHLFVTPLVPTFSVDPNALVIHRINGTYEWNAERDRSCEKEHGAVVYRNATWKADVGCWLSQCGNSSFPIPVVEKFWRNSCTFECDGRGVCNKELAQCRCSVGFSGVGCEKVINRKCNKGVTDEQPYGSWGVSVCPGFCDKRTAHCLCGNTTKYPDRPLAEACGFHSKGNTGEIDWTKADTDYIYGNKSYQGWCNLDAEDVHDKNIRVKLPQCDCKYDGQWGVVCESPSESFCINQCNLNGICHQGFCACRKGWYGVDCSVPSYLPPPVQRPKWLPQEAAPDVSDETNRISVASNIMKKRPLVYVYDLPAEFTTQFLQGRHFKFECVNRLYDVDNATIWTENLYGAGIALYESLLASEHRTTNGDEADFFYVPFLQACIVEQGDAAPHLTFQGKYMGLRQYFAGDYSKQIYFHIQQNYPYWNRSAGRDHIWFFPWDEGACSAPKEIWNSMMLSHWGNTNAKHKASTTAYRADNWDLIPPEWRGDHPCYDPAKDLVLPAWKFPDPYPIVQNLSSRHRQDRPTLFYFNGNLGSAYDNGRPEPGQKLAAEFGSQPNKKGLLGRQAVDDVVVQAQRSPQYKLELSKSRFCGVLPGDGWSGRMEDSILSGCIPVIIQDGIHLPFENVLDYESFTVRVAEDNIHNLITILKAINEAQVDSMLAVVRGLWQRFTYHYAVKLEANRQKLKLNKEDLWASVQNSLTGDDAFSTFIHVLEYKLHTDTWRSEMKQPLKNYGVPDNCR
ncbi:uncharacterized protein [Physcomitrium patens]|uniref:uncharacterized protein isoform X3 n=1 Tax=Physcomitrium patens TaxID=3218 RepID=UPI000D151816|nr:uncharacterized protein LOC112280793 isoform X3 [Physcomitrium patens]|eukprot:XP_024372401.1 uncharacterized protein LOC112280793 isoform X3 [Physcomitrella patens]